MVDLSGAYYALLCQSLYNQARTRVSSRSLSLEGGDIMPRFVIERNIPLLVRRSAKRRTNPIDGPALPHYRI
jgi:hypothetical protein